MSYLLRSLLVGFIAIAVAGCQRGGDWHMRDISGDLPALAFHMVRASDGKEVTAEVYRHQIVLLYFGYTQCGDACPLTLGNLAAVIKKLGPAADRVQVLFATVDPNRDDLETLRDYTADLGPRFDGLRGDANDLASLARRYRVVLSAGREAPDKPYVVTHSISVYVFDGTGAARLITTATDDTTGMATDILKLLQEEKVS